MSRPRTPTNVLELRGAFDKNPQRRREEPKVEPGLGDPPAHFGDDRRAAWLEIEEMAPAGVLSRSDRLAAEMLADLLARFRSGAKFTSADRRDMLAILSRFGMTAADRSRVAAPKEKDQTDIWDILGEPGNAA